MSTTMSVTTKRNQSVIATSWSTAVQSDYIGRKNVIVTTQPRNTSRVWVAPSFERSNACPPSDSFKALGNNDHRFFSAPKGFKVEYLYYYTDSGTQYLDWEASDGSLEDLTPYDYDDLTRMEWLADGSYTERWEQGFRKKLYHGRTGAYFESESLANTPFRDWTPPKFETGVNTLQAAPYNNAINMTNTKDGTTIDEVYVGLPKAHFRMVMRIDAMMPTLAHLGVNDVVFFGFETNSAGGACAAGLFGGNGAYNLQIVMVDQITAQATTQSIAVTLAHTGVFCEYHLIWDYPVLTLLQYWGGARTVLATLVVVGGQPMKMIPMVTNESETNIITDFKWGTLQVWEIEPKIPQVIGSCSQIASTNAFASALKVPTVFKNRLIVQLHEHNTNAIQYEILASMDNVTWTTLLAATDLAQNGSAAYYLTDPWMLLDVQIIDKVAGTHGKLDCTIGGN